MASDLVSDGLRYARAPVNDIACEAVPGERGGLQLIRLRATQRRVDVLDRDGRVVRTDAAAEIKKTVALTWRDGRWLVFDAQ